MVSVNNSTSGAEAHLPFGGNGKSGNGSRQSGVWVLDQFTRWQAMNWDYSGRLQKAQMDVADVAADLDLSPARVSYGDADALALGVGVGGVGVPPGVVVAPRASSPAPPASCAASSSRLVGAEVAGPSASCAAGSARRAWASSACDLLVDGAGATAAVPTARRLLVRRAPTATVERIAASVSPIDHVAAAAVHDDDAA